ncbi:MAG: membrane protein insertase YidC, partial [Burkholderiaceae bacterium]|nr:membrane protein insertase YidC [Burkholderiaceae bacterium]
MEIQRTILWIIFAMSLLLLWDSWQRYQGRPSMLGAPPATEQKKADPAAADAVPVPAAPAAMPAQPVSAPPPAAEPPARRLRVETDVFVLEFDPNGAALVHAELKQQKVAPDWTASGLLGLITGRKQDRDANVVLLEWSKHRVYLARTGLTGPGGARFPNHLTPFTPLPGATQLAPGADRLEVRFAAEAGGVRLTKTYVLKRGRYDIEVRHAIENLGTEPVTPSVYLQLVRDGNKPEGESALYYTFTGPAVYTEAQKFQKLAFEDIAKKKAQHAQEAKDGWIAMIQHYFVSAWVPPQGEHREIRSAQDAPNLYSISTVMPLAALPAGGQTQTTATLWVGPQDQRALAALAPGLDLVVDYGWLTFIAKPLYWLLEFLHRLVGNWGWAIILLTILVKAAFYPLSAASYRSM